VQKVFERKTNEFIKLYFAKDSIICTFEHPFFVNNDWKEAKNLNPGDSLFAYAGNELAKMDFNTSENIIDMSSHVNGTYFLCVVIGEQSETFKIIKME